MKQYHDMLRHILENGVESDDRTGVGTVSVFGYQNRYDLSKGFPLLTTKKVHTKSILWELIWFLQGRTDNQWLNKRGVTIWNEWATKEQCAKFNREEGDLGPIYGRLWRSFNDSLPTDQIANLFYQMAHSPNSRRLIVTGWNPATADTVALPPCHTLWQVYIRDGKLSLHLYQRSADAFLGVPFNITSYTALVHLLCRLSRHDLQPGDFIHTFGDLHIYKNHFEQVDLLLSREERPLPTLTIDPTLNGMEEQGINHLTLDSFRIDGYDPHPVIKAPVAV